MFPISNMYLRTLLLLLFRLAGGGFSCNDD